MAVASKFIDCCLIAVLSFGPIKGAYAWEADVHYGLVKWLAVHAGFSVDDAEIVAAASESPDETKVLSAVGVSTLTICPWGSEEASRHVQRFHFPTGGYPPAQPSERTVVPGHSNYSISSNRWVRQEVNTGWGRNNVEKETRLYQFGTSLHPLADSWSHQGEPGILFACPTELGWGHPHARGGPRKHDADLTHKYPEDTKETAESLYRFMKEFLLANKTMFLTGSRKEFDELTSDIDEFSRHKTKRGKYAWFRKQTDVIPYNDFSTYPCFLRDLSLPRDEGRARRPIPCADQVTIKDRKKTKYQTAQPIENQRNESDIRTFIDNFLERWILERNYESVVKDFFIEDAVRNTLLGDQASYVADVYGSNWGITLLSMWLVEDHGLVNELGHGLPNEKGRIPLVEVIDGLRKIGRVKTISEAIESIHGVSPYDLSLLGTDRGYIVTFKFRHIFHDVLYLRAVQKGQIWRVTGFDWMAH